ncbi:hypothetical protein [Anaerorhabdus sp.]|uniref:hypothetical protein n=1 Tax=Anaerorhabdus sp. TaxID=1872524 RepID=UPI002FC8753D
MNNIIDLYKTYISPIVIGVLIITIVITIFYLVRLFLGCKSLLSTVDEVIETTNQVQDNLVMTKNKKDLMQYYFKKKKAELSFLISALFFLHILNHKD